MLNVFWEAVRWMSYEMPGGQGAYGGAGWSGPYSPGQYSPGQETQDWSAYPFPQQQGWPAGGGAYPAEGYSYCNLQPDWPQAYYPQQAAQQNPWAWPQQAGGYARLLCR